MTQDEKLAHIFKRFYNAIKPKKLLSGSMWADTYRYVAAGTSPEPGRWQTSRVPYMREPMDMATKRTVEQVVIMAASQLAKSEMLLNIMGYYIAQEPSSILFLQPTIDNAKAFSKERIDPNIKATPELRIALNSTDDKAVGAMRASGDTIREKVFPGGFLAIIGSRSPSDLASKPIRVVLADEIDRYEVTKEGDPLKLARQRTANFNNRKLIYVSTPTVKHRDDGGPSIYDEYELSDKREYQVKCPYCEQYFVMRWDQVKWDKDENDNVIEETIRLECPLCHVKVRGPGKPSPHLLESGKWVPTAKSKIVGFHMTALVSPWVNLSQMVEEFVRAARSRDKKGLREFFNLRLGEPFEEYKGALLKWERLLQRCELYPVAGFCRDIIFLTAGVDVQRDRLECSIFGWSVGWESWLIKHHVISGNPLEPYVWEQLDDILFRTDYVNEDGRKRQLVCTCVDSGDGISTDRVYAYTKAREIRRVVSIKGRAGMAVPFTNRPTRAGTKKSLLYTLGVDAGKDLIMSSLEVPSRGPNFVHFPRGEQYVDAEYFKQLTSEVQKPVRNKTTGAVRQEWVKLRERNEALDCAVYARAAATILQPDFELLRDQLRGL